MSAVEYNNLLFKISQKLNELNVGEQLLAMCRGKIAVRSEENMQDASVLFEELEEKKFLGPDRLEVLKELLEGVEQWSLLEKVEKFEKTRKEYNDLLEQIIRELGELNELERLIAMCRENIAEDRQGNVHDVRSLFKELENNNCLGINRLGILKEILTQTEKSDLLKEVEEFEQRRSREKKFERRQAQAAAIVSSASGNLAGVLNIKTVFKVVAGGIVVASAYELLRRGSTYDQLITAINTCVLPAGARLIEITEGSVYLTVQAENVSALNTVWSLYKNGTLKARLQALLVTDEMRELAGGVEVEVIVNIDEQEYEKALSELTNKAQEGSDGLEDEQLKYLHQDKLSYIQSYLEKAEDTYADSIGTETSDSGSLGSHVAPSEFGMKETSDSTSKLCLKDLSKAVTKKVIRKLESDQVALERFYKSYGLDPNTFNRKRLRKINELYPDTPVKVLKDVFEALQLFDLVELLEKVKPRTLRPALPLKEIGKLPNASNRPTKFYTKAEVLIIDFNTSVTEDNAERIGSFFKEFNSRSELTTLTAKPAIEVFRQREELGESKLQAESEDWSAEWRETELKKLLKKEKPKDTRTASKRYRFTTYTLHLRVPPFMSVKEGDLPAMKKELRKEYEKFEMAVSTVMDKWTQHAQNEGEESTLFVVLTDDHYWDQQLEIMIGSCLKKKLAFIPNTKLVITSNMTSWMGKKEMPRETLHVDGLVHQIESVPTMLELLNKRWKTLDLVSVMMELQRTLAISTIHSQFVKAWRSIRARKGVKVQGVKVQENLSCLPRLEKTEEI